VTDEPGWPQDSGYRQRVRHLLLALGRVAAVDVLLLRADPAPPPPSGLVHSTEWTHVRTRPPLHALLAWARGAGPWVVVAQDWTAAERRLRALAPDSYDLVWFEHPEVWAALSHLSASVPVVLDLDNVMSVVLARSARLRPRWKRPLDAWDAVQWRRVERRAVRDADAVAVCSGRDRDLLGGSSTVVPNGYQSSPTAFARRPPAVPVLCFVGLLHYPPNTDAVEWFAREILPRIRQQRPGTRFRVLGDAGGSPRVAALAALPGVDLAGHVSDLTTELLTSSAAVVPLRSGGGTRIKVLEAFALGLPVVSTSIGCEGIAAEPGEHLLVADDAQGFAQACLALIERPDLAASIAQSARQLHADHYDWAPIEADVEALVRRHLHLGGQQGDS
jgi:glycosyltransferase involved in cell wall biosynthesis